MKLRSKMEVQVRIQCPYPAGYGCQSLPPIYLVDKRRPRGIIQYVTRSLLALTHSLRSPCCEVSYQNPAFCSMLENERLLEDIQRSKRIDIFVVPF